MASDVRAVNLLLCRDILVDYSGSQTIIGTLSGMRVSGFPVSYPRLAVLVGLEGTDLGDGVTTTVTRDNELSPIATHFHRADKRFDRGSVSLEARFDDVVFPESGNYRVRVFNDRGEQLISRRFYVEQASLEELNAHIQEAQKAELISQLPQALKDVEDIPASEVSQLINADPFAANLYLEVRNSLGDQLSCVRKKDATQYSSHLFWFTPPEMRLAQAFVQLSGVIPNPAAALTGQLLLMRLSLRGYPIVISAFPDESWIRPDTAFGQITRSLTSILFEIAFSEEPQSGFPRTEMFAPSVPNDYANEEKVLRAGIALKLPSRVIRAQWNAMYFCKWMYERQTGQQGDAFEIKKRGRAILPELGDDAEKMKDWVLSKSFLDPNGFIDSVKRLFDVIGFPRVGFARLERRATGLYQVAIQT